MNAPDRFELFILPDGVKKISYVPDPNVDKAATFTIEKEDHTIGNLIRYQLLKENQVTFAGYKMPHPLEHHVTVKVQTVKETAPETMMAKALNDLIGLTGHLRQKFVEELAKAKAASISGDTLLIPEHDSLHHPHHPQQTMPPTLSAPSNVGGGAVANLQQHVDMDF
ncbi:2069_t:CDS:2 [Ambispora gerdemannii]|uniref:2069_t:CDS:1 n=1 Tax=Ambispora gerdemannii TaxID=144530 RepID=A0A9N8ZB75_9GLOM|nr:2069_t:CDS:2 [Ambispora gerdemannii]